MVYNTDVREWKQAHYDPKPGQCWCAGTDEEFDDCDGDRNDGRRWLELQNNLRRFLDYS